MIDPKTLLGTKFLPANYKQVRLLSRTARAYHALKPYPSYSAMTREWKTEERGPFPRCRPFVQNIVNKGATWLFGKPVTFKVACDEELEESDPRIEAYEELTKLINSVWKNNDMTRRARVAAVVGALSGGVVAKFSYTEAEGVQIDLLDPAEQVQLYWDNDNHERLVMARIQYPVYDPTDGCNYWHREEYTDKIHRVYKRVSNSMIGGNVTSDPYAMIDQVEAYGTWEIASENPNAFGIIPLWYIRNRETGTQYGEGDLWTMYEIIDQVNFTKNLAHIDNQKSIDPTKAFIDLTAADGDDPVSTGDQSVLILESKVDAMNPKQGRVDLLQTNAALRPHLDAFAKELKQELMQAVGSVEVDAEDITNKGNLTAAVMTQIYAPIIERTNEKRQLYGEDGFCVFMERLCIGMANLGSTAWAAGIGADVQIQWPPFFEQTEDEKGQLADRQLKLVEGGLTTKELAVRKIATSDDVHDVDELLEQIKVEQEERDAKASEKEDVMASAMARQRRSLSGDLPGSVKSKKDSQEQK